MSPRAMPKSQDRDSARPRWPEDPDANAKVKSEADADPEYGETGLNFSSASGVDYRRGKLARQDPMSHRIIEKRRRDRMNNCLADLSRLIPPDYLKKGRGRIEKTEIIEMAIKHLKYLQERANCAEQRDNGPISAEYFRMGYQECLSEVMRYLVEGQSHFPRDATCVQLINHLQRHCDNIMKGDVLNKPRCNPDSNSSSSGSSSNYAIHSQNISTNSIQRIKAKVMEMNSGERHHQHSNTFKNQNDDKTTNSEIEHNRLAPESVEDSPEETMNDTQDMYVEENMSPLPLVNYNNYIGMNLVEGNPDEGGGRNRTDFLRKSISEMPDCQMTNVNDNQSIQDLRIQNQYSPVSPNYYQHPQHHCEQNLRNIRQGEPSQPGDSGLSLSSNQGDVDNMHLYKFKNTIKQRFSQSQSTDYFSSSPSDGMNSYTRGEHQFARREQFGSNGKMAHKKRKTSNEHQSRYSSNCYDVGQYKDQMSSSETNSSENITSVSQASGYNRSNKLQDSDMKNRRPSTEKDYHKLSQHIVPIARHGKMYNEKLGNSYGSQTGIGVPIFALHAKGSFYVPMNVDYECLTPFLGAYDLLDAASFQPNISLHPVTISVNFQPTFFSIKQIPTARNKVDHKDWQ